jgi:hypothetical protein
VNLTPSQNLILLLNEGYSLNDNLKKVTELQVFFIYEVKNLIYGEAQPKIPENHLTMKSGDSLESIKDTIKLLANYNR